MARKRSNLDERFYRARDAFSEPRFKALYRGWKEDGDTAFAACRSHVLDEVVIAGAGRVETLELGHRYGHLSLLLPSPDAGGGSFEASPEDLRSESAVASTADFALLWSGASQ
jgi:hypothetical protein